MGVSGERTIIFPTRLNLQLLAEAASAEDAPAKSTGEAAPVKRARASPQAPAKSVRKPAPAKTTTAAPKRASPATDTVTKAVKTVKQVSYFPIRQLIASSRASNESRV